MSSCQSSGLQGTQNPDESQWTIDGQELSNVRPARVSGCMQATIEASEAAESNA